MICRHVMLLICSSTAPIALQCTALTLYQRFCVQEVSRADRSSRRDVLQLAPAFAALVLGSSAGPSSAVQGLTAGRLPGKSP